MFAVLCLYRIMTKKQAGITFGCALKYCTLLYPGTQNKRLAPVIIYACNNVDLFFNLI